MMDGHIVKLFQEGIRVSLREASKFRILYPALLGNLSAIMVIIVILSSGTHV
jgi:hypothetical protein